MPVYRSCGIGVAVGTSVGDGIGVDVGIVVAVGSGSDVTEAGEKGVSASGALAHAATRNKAAETITYMDFGILCFGEL